MLIYTLWFYLQFEWLEVNDFCWKSFFLSLSTVSRMLLWKPVIQIGNIGVSRGSACSSINLILCVVFRFAHLLWQMNIVELFVWLQTRTVRKCNITVVITQRQKEKKKSIRSFCQSMIATQPLPCCQISSKIKTRDWLLDVTKHSTAESTENALHGCVSFVVNSQSSLISNSGQWQMYGPVHTWYQCEF